MNSINESVDALEGLFSELLDITRIDSGGVEVNPQSFSIGDIFRKLRLHYEPTAFEKGLGLSFRGSRHVALADPLLVERILRNLVSNAIRYTVDGSVLVSARRVGESIRLQVWDTGRHRRRGAGARLRGVLPGARHAHGGARRAQERAGPRPGDRQAAGAADAGADLAALPARPRLGLHPRAAGRHGAAPRAARAAAARARRAHARRPADRDRRGRAGGARGPGGAAARLGRRDRRLRERRRDPRLGRGERSEGGAAGAGHRRLSARARRDRGRGDRPAAPALRRCAAGDRRHRQQHDRPRQGSDGARLPPADQAGAAEQAPGDDRLQAGEEARRGARPPSGRRLSSSGRPGARRSARTPRPG